MKNRIRKILREETEQEIPNILKRRFNEPILAKVVEFAYNYYTPGDSNMGKEEFVDIVTNGILGVWEREILDSRKYKYGSYVTKEMKKTFKKWFSAVFEEKYDKDTEFVKNFGKKWKNT